ncbi:MAG TPA: glycosyltransferase family 2 protein [Patescibacteria group bacterium]|nr:glycosyltransferase family 2 protein [Patescibacteria group bacterium]
MNRPGISVVIVSWNTKDITDRCLSAMKKAVAKVKSKADVEVIVVENDSEDGTAEMIAKKHPWVKLKPSGSDLGYGKGNNFGYKKANPKYDYLLLLNNDAYVNEDTLVKSLEYMEKNTNCDVLGCQLRFLDGRFQPSAGFLPNPTSVWSWIWGLDLVPGVNKLFKPFHPTDKDFFKKDREVGWTMGAFLFMKMEVFKKSGGFDENFFMYMEEVEWCRRVNMAGYKIWYTPGFWITHVDKASAMGKPEELAKIFRREILGFVYYLRKNYANQEYWFMPSIKAGIILRYLTFSILGNKMRQDAYSQTLKELFKQ